MGEMCLPTLTKDFSISHSSSSLPPPELNNRRSDIEGTFSLSTSLG